MAKKQPLTGPLAILTGFMQGLNQGLERKRVNDMEQRKLGLLVDDRDTKRAELGLKGRELGLKAQELALKAKEPQKLNAGQESLDKEFGKEVADFQGRGGFADVEKDLRALDNVITYLEDPKNKRTGFNSPKAQAMLKALGDVNVPTAAIGSAGAGALAGSAIPGVGTVVGAVGGGMLGTLAATMSKAAREGTSQESVALEAVVHQVLQKNIRLALGGQFTEKEGKSFVERGYNSSMDDDLNLANLKAARNTIATKGKALDGATKYFIKNQGTLLGYSGSLPGDIAKPGYLVDEDPTQVLRAKKGGGKKSKEKPAYAGTGGTEPKAPPPAIDDALGGALTEIMKKR